MNVQNILLNKFNGTFIMRRVPLGVLIASLAASPVYAGRTLHYKTYHPQTGENFNRFHCSIEEIPSGGYKVHWVTEEGEVKTEEDYVLNADFETIWWRVFEAQGKTDYAGERKGDSIFIRGVFKGSKVDNVIALDERPFYYNPKLGLLLFV